MALSEDEVLSLKREKITKNVPRKAEDIKRALSIKFFFFYVISFILLVVFWYYISCFCAVYRNTQIHLMKDTLVSYALSMAYPFALNLLPGFFRIPALRTEKGDKGCMYKISLYVALI